MVDIYFLSNNKYFPVLEDKISNEPTQVELAKTIESYGRFYLEGKHSLRDSGDKSNNYDGDTGFTDMLAIQHAKELGRLFDAEQVVIKPDYAVGTQSYKFKYKFELRIK